jgi:hypothetical protein
LLVEPSVEVLWPDLAGVGRAGSEIEEDATGDEATRLLDAATAGAAASDLTV